MGLVVDARNVPALSSRAAATPSSAIRDLLDQANRPGMISFAGGLPDASMFPVTELAQITAAVIERSGRQVLQYGATRGSEVVRASLTSLFSDCGGAGTPGVEADDVVVTTGSQQGLDLLARVLLDPGDKVIVGDPDYLGALQVFRGYGAELCPIAIDHDGLNTEQLEDHLRWGLRPKLLYLVPNFHNPTGTSISVERRRHLDQLSTTYGFVVVEDDPYRELFFDGAPPRAGRGDPELTVRLRSTSKTLMPGLRVGVIAGPSWLIEPVITAKQSADLHTSGLTQAIVADAIQAPWFMAHLDNLRTAYRSKRDAFAAELRDQFGGTIEFDPPAGGMFVWARFSDVDDSAYWLQATLDRGVCFVPGASFAVARDLSAHARLSFATSTLAELRDGTARLLASR